MNTKDVQRALELVSVACGRMAELRERRAGSRTHRQLADELALLGRSILTTSGPHRASLLAHKAGLFHHEHVLGELGNLKAVLAAARECAARPSVRTEIEKGHAAEEVFARFRDGFRKLDGYQSAVVRHEELLHHVLGGVPRSAAVLARLDQDILAYDLWAGRVRAAAEGAVQRVRSHPAPLEVFSAKAAAALALAVANAV